MITQWNSRCFLVFNIISVRLLIVEGIGEMPAVSLKMWV